MLDAELGGRLQVRRGELIDALGAAGVVATWQGRMLGLATCTRDPADAEVAEVTSVVVAASHRRRGIGKALLRGAASALAAAGIRRAWLVTTNDNLAALALYQKAGWRLATLRPGAIEAARRTLKPSIPAIGEHGIPLRDELELVLELESTGDVELRP
jgi:ribosomal protein S18 acetylase RimI-like enzyme